MIGVLTGIAGEVNLGHLVHKGLTVRGIYVGSREMFEAMIATIAKHKLEPIVDRIFSFAESIAALKHLESGQYFGKVVIQV